MGNLKDEILGIVSTVIEMEPKDIPLDAHLIQEVGANSMDALEILAALEKKYKIVIPEEKLQELTTVNKIIAMAEGAKKKKK